MDVMTVKPRVIRFGPEKKTTILDICAASESEPPTGTKPKVGEVWEEIAIRRKVRIIGFDRHGNVRTKCKRIGVAQLRRFNGKRGGYRLVAENVSIELLTANEQKR